MLIRETARSKPFKTTIPIPKTHSVSERQKLEDKIRRDTDIQKAKRNLEKKTAARIAAEKERDDCFNAGRNGYDILADESISEKAEATYKALCATAEKAKVVEQQARKGLFAATYDTMPDAELQAVVDRIEDEEEKAYAVGVQKERTAAFQKKELKTMSAIGDPTSVLYDPEFAQKSAYRSTKLTDGSLGEMDTGYADIDYEFINGNPEISELIVGKEKNYYYITDQERQIYNFWHNYDLEHGTTTAKNFLDLLQETLNARASEQEYAKIEGNALLEAAYGVKSAISTFSHDTNNGYLKPDGYIPVTATEMTAQKAREGLADEGDFIKLNGQSLGQLAFDGTEKITEWGISKALELATWPYAKWVGMAVGGSFSGMSAYGEEYRERTARGYGTEQAKTYAEVAGVSAGIADIASSVARHGAGKLLKNIASNDTTRALGKVLTKEDWFGIADAVRSGIQPYVEKSVTGETKPDAETLQAAAKNAVTVKAMDKIFNRMKATPEELSLDLRRSLLDSLKDPASRKALTESGAFTADQLDEIATGLALAGDEDDAVGTYVGDVVYGENGFAMNKQYLRQIVDEALHNRNTIIDPDEADALLARYIPQWKRNRRFY